MNTFYILSQKSNVIVSSVRDLSSLSDWCEVEKSTYKFIVKWISDDCSSLAYWNTPASRLFTHPFIQAQMKENISSASLAFVWGIHRWMVNSIHRWPVNSPHRMPVTRKMFPFDDAIMSSSYTPAILFGLHRCSTVSMIMSNVVSGYFCHPLRREIIFWSSDSNLQSCKQSSVKFKWKLKSTHW